jgi:hypothetical protein
MGWNRQENRNPDVLVAVKQPPNHVVPVYRYDNLYKLHKRHSTPAVTGLGEKKGIELEVARVQGLQ